MTTFTNWTFSVAGNIGPTGPTGPNMAISDAPPASPAAGQLWFESDTGLTYIYYDSSWVEIGAGSSYETVINTIQAKGDLLAGTASQALGRLTVGTNNQRLIANSSTATGLSWANDTTNTVIDTKGDLLVGATADVVAKLPVGTDNQVLVADSTATNGVSWQSRPLNMPWGIISYTTKSTGTTNISTATTTLLTAPSFTLTSSRYIKITGRVDYIDNASSVTDIYVSLNNGSGVVADSSIVSNVWPEFTSAVPVQFVGVLAAGTYTYRMDISLVAGTNRVNHNISRYVNILIEDIGPA